MRILLFGAAGQVGSTCASLLINNGHDVIAITRKENDFADEADVERQVLSSCPEFVVNACAYTAVDRAESEEELADQINHRSVARLAATCGSLRIPLLHLSTDYVFDGRAAKPYVESAPVNPLGVYGETKLKGEQAILDSTDTFIILRTSWVFGEVGNNFVKTMLKLGAEREYLRVVNDQRGRPTYTGHIVSVIAELIDYYRHTMQSFPWGIYHCSSQGEVSWYEFAQSIFQQAVDRGVLSRPPMVEPIPSKAYPTPVPRPSYSVLATDKLEALIGRSIPGWQEGLARYFDSLAICGHSH